MHVYLHMPTRGEGTELEKFIFVSTNCNKIPSESASKKQNHKARAQGVSTGKSFWLSVSLSEQLELTEKREMAKIKLNGSQREWRK